MSVVDEVGRDDLVAGVGEDVFQVSVAGSLHRGANLFVACLLHGADRQVNDRHRWCGYPKRHTCQLALYLWYSQTDSSGGAGAGRNDVDGGGPASFPVLLGRAIDRFL